MVVGGYQYKDGTRYFGEWNEVGQRHGYGHLVLPDETKYDGHFHEGLFSGLGILRFSDGTRYEGQFTRGWFHGYGIFLRKDGTKFEGEFRAGKICGYGLVTYTNFKHGFPRQEGFFQNGRLVYRKNCADIVLKAQSISYLAQHQLKEHKTVGSTDL